MSRQMFSEKRLLKLVPEELNDRRLGYAVEDSNTQLLWLRDKRREATRLEADLLERIAEMNTARRDFEDEQEDRG